jgi:hypothetical protein
MDGRFMELALTPSGRITLCQTTDLQSSPPASSTGAETDGQLGRVAKVFGISQGEGLFLLATERFEGPLPPAFSYWREFAVGYLTALCHTPEIAGLELQAIAPPTPACTRRPTGSSWSTTGFSPSAAGSISWCARSRRCATRSRGWNSGSPAGGPSSRGFVRLRRKPG